MGKLTNLKSFPQFSVDFGDNSSSKTITESALFALDSLLYVMNLSLPKLIQMHLSLFHFTILILFVIENPI